MVGARTGLPAKTGAAELDDKLTVMPPPGSEFAEGVVHLQYDLFVRLELAGASGNVVEVIANTAGALFPNRSGRWLQRRQASESVACKV